METATAAAQPSALIAKLAKPPASYKRRAWLAVAALLGFVLLYFALAGWFALTAYQLTIGAGINGKDPFWGWVVGLCAAFLSVFMCKAVFFVQRGNSGDCIEITAQEQGELFRFLHHLADKAGAPRPHRVFVSARVNAAVFYDLSLLNLVLPSKKNLEIGLGLVNSLTLGELRAVLAHEFGHFAQRAMAVGRWVYMAQQIAAHLIARRDKLDDFVRALSHFDVRVAWIGWIVSVVVWAIRSLIDTAFQGVMLIQRALSREMEMNADLVAVSLTGSDALIHALHRLQAADDAWNRAHGFVMGGKARGRLTRDLFAIQSRIAENMGQLLNDPTYGRVPALPADNAQAHRVFKAELAQPPQMWLTHPLNHEREANAKRHYVSAPIDERSAWALFVDATALRERVTAHLLGNAEGTPEPIADSLQILNQQFEREFLDRRYRGVYFGRSVVRAAASAAELSEPCSLQGQALVQALDALYPSTLTDEVERARGVEQELAQLRALHSGNLRPPGGSIAHRGRILTRAQLPQHIGQVERELEACHARLSEHDRRCRSLHRAAAAAVGAGWSEVLEGLLAVMHYADHGEADLRDAQALLANTVAVVTATRRVNQAGVERTVRDANALYGVLSTLYSRAASVELAATLLERLGVAKWSDALGELGLHAASKDNIQAWLNVVDGWVNPTAGALRALHDHALEQLLRVEAEMARHLREGTTPAEASAAEASRVAPGYAVLLPGQQRKRQTRLDWWARFQTADGALPMAARLLVAGAIVAVVLGVGATVGSAKLVVYNGLAREVSVTVGDKRALAVAAHAHASIDIDAQARMPIETRTREGQLIERFDADAATRYGQFVYNVAGAALLAEWTALYGGGTPPPPQMLGGPRWTLSHADHLFTDPPQSLRSKGPTSRRVLESPRDASPGDVLGALPDDAERARVATAHARWDRLDSRHIAYWLHAAQSASQWQTVLAQRLAESPDNVLLLRAAQDSVSDDARAAVCRAHEAASAAAPANANLKYARVRCIADGAAKNAAFEQGQRQHPDHAWFAYAAGYSAAEQAQWARALALFEVAGRNDASMTDWLGVDIVRMKRVLGQDSRAGEQEMARASDLLRRLLQLESGQDLAPDAPARAYAELAQGHLERALQLAARDKHTQARVLRLAAASDGADAALVAKALSLPADQGMDDSTLWPSVALAARAGHDLGALPTAAKGVRAPPSAPLLAFVAALRSGASAEQAEALLDGLGPEMRGHGYSIGSTLLGNKAPAAWRDKAKRLLFAAERPYFR